MINSKKNLNLFFINCLILLGVLNIYGWLTGNFWLVYKQVNSAPMIMGTGLFFILSGFILLRLQTNAFKTDKLIRALVCLLIISALAYIFEYFSRVDLGIDFRDIHQQFSSNGRPAINTLIAFLFFAFAVVLINDETNQEQELKKSNLSETFAFIVVILGVIGTFGALVDLKELYTWGGYFSMSMITGIGLTALGMLLISKISDLNRKTLTQINYDKKIGKVTIVLILIIGLGTASLSFSFYQKQVDEILKKEIKTLSINHSNIIYQSISNRFGRAKLLSESKDIIEIANQFHDRPNDVQVIKQIKNLKVKLVQNGFDEIDLIFEEKLIAFENNEIFSVNLKGFEDAYLAWDKSYFLKANFPIARNGKILAYLTTSQKLPFIDQLLPETVLNGDTNNFVLCGNGGLTLKCFPNRFNTKPSLIPRTIRSQPLPILNALDSGQTGVAKALDSRGVMVFAGYTPVEKTGLAIVEKIDISQVYEPIKATFLKIVLIILIVLTIGYLIVLKQLKPLIKLVVEEKNQANIQNQRFIAAVEGGIDNFYIFEAVRDQLNNIVDLRCVYINQSGSALINKTPDEMIGKLLLEEVPVNKEVRLFSKYKYVIETGNTVAEEFAIDDKDVNANWIYWQIVKLGDGVAVTSRDITEKKRLEEELKRSNSLSSAIIDSAQYSIIATDTNGLIISINKAAERMLWYSEDELVGKHTPEIIHDKEEVIIKANEFSLELGRKIEPGFEVFVAKAVAGLSNEDEWTYVRKDGSKFPVKLSVTVLKDDSNFVYGYLGVAYDISEQKRVQEYISHIALHDVLTGLPNRALFDDRAKVAITNAKRDRTFLGVVMLDLDHFKYINDSLGHHIGDKLLQIVSRRITETIRPTDTVARMGGDEFAFLFPDIHHPEGSHRLLNKLLNVFSNNIEINGNKLHPTPSIGMAVYPIDGEDIDVLLKNADTAMYKAKSIGRNGYQIYDNNMRHDASQRVIREEALRRAINDEAFELFFQPQIRLSTMQIVGVEALIRWKNEQDEYVSPEEFIPLAEETGLIIPLGNWVIENAVERAKAFEKLFGKPIRMAVNISARQFKQVELIDTILGALKTHSLSPDLFELEITESLLMDDVENCVQVMTLLNSKGIRIALDDFGTGYSSLSYLSKFKFDRIKIDQSFIKGCINNPEEAAIIKAIISMSKALGVDVIAEGVETSQQLEFIKMNECDEGQGFFIGIPMPFSSYERISGNYLWT